MTDLDAVVVGAGPNGLTAAILLARAGRSVTVLEAKPTIGGGTRTEELTLPGFRHDVCSAFHPLGAASPAFASMPLEDHGLEWIVPEVQVAHPLDDGTAVALWHSEETSASALDVDGPRWSKLVRPITEHWELLGPSLLEPLLGVPSHPMRMLSLLPAARSATAVARRFSLDRTKALFAGISAHSMQPLNAGMTAASGILLGGLAHVGGWPLARGGSKSITSALASYLESLGGTIITDRPVQTRHDLPESTVVLFNTSPNALTSVYGTSAPHRTQRWIDRYQYGPGSFKVDYALDGPIPWTAPECHSAGTVHVGGTADQIASAEADVARKLNPSRPFVLVGQQSLFDDSRAPAGKHTAWAYTHVPNGFRGTVTEQIEAQIERFAPGFRHVIAARNVMGTAQLESHNPNYVGGDIGGGATSLRQLIARPRLTTDPYSTGIPGVYLCSASTPPGPGVHGMSGFNAAQRVLAGPLR